MIEISTMDRQELCKLVKPMLPVYVINTGPIFEAFDISTNMFRDVKSVEMYSIKSKELQPYYPKCNSLRIQTGQYITKDLNEAEEYFKIKKAHRIKCEYKELKEKYNDYTDFIKNNSEYFLI